MPGNPDFARLMKGVLPYLAIESTEKAVAFYETAFGAILHGQMTKDPSGRVLNATVEINDGIIMFMDAVPGTSDPVDQTATNRGLTLQLVSRDGDMWWNRAIAAGCSVTAPFEMQFWGDRYGRMRDPFGLDWGLVEPGPGR